MTKDDLLRRKGSSKELKDEKLRRMAEARRKIEDKKIMQECLR